MKSEKKMDDMIYDPSSMATGAVLKISNVKMETVTCPTPQKKITTILLI